MAETSVRLGIIGCGAVAQLCHLPAARTTREVKIVALADKDITRARFLGRRFGIDCYSEDYHQFLKMVDGMIIALPHYAHAPIASELLEMGMPVLVEKPLAITVEEAKKLIEKARVSKVPLQAGYMYRFNKGVRLVKRAIDEGWLGALQSFSLEFGSIYGWPVASGFFWKKDQAGGGVLIDTGSHMLDLLLWWLGDAVDVEYRDDCLGGVEADCRLSLALKGPAGTIRGEVALSRLRKLGTKARIIGERFSIECGLAPGYEVRIRPSMWNGGELSFLADYGPSSGDSYRRMYAEQLRAFAMTIRGHQPVVSGESVLGSVALIERCYRERKPIELPWIRRGVYRG